MKYLIGLLGKFRLVQTRINLASFLRLSWTGMTSLTLWFPKTIRDWNDLPDSLVSSAEVQDHCVNIHFSCES